METARCDIMGLPEDLLAEIISLTSPLDAIRAAAVSRAFLAAADSDAVWSRFLPHDLPPPLDDDATELSLVGTSKRSRFMHLSDHPILLPCKLMRMWLDGATGGKCYKLSARALNISWVHDPCYWRWIHLDGLHDIKAGKRIASEAVRLMGAAWLEIRAKIEGKMLSQNSTYGVYLVFQMDHGAYGLGFPFQEGLISVGGSVSTRRACLQGYDEDGAGGVVTRKYVIDSTTQWKAVSSTALVEDDVVLPRRRADGWMELELADGFYNHEDGDGEVCVALNDTKHLCMKSGLIVQSIEFRTKQHTI